MKEDNISKVESIVRIITGVVIFVLGYKISDFVSAYLTGYYPQNSIYFFIFKFHNLLQILLFFVGFVLAFTGITRFSVLKHLLGRKDKPKS